MPASSGFARLPHGAALRLWQGSCGLVASLLLAAAGGAQDLPPLDASFAETGLVIVAAAECHRFVVYLALERQQQRRGLMFVRDLPERRGMLFVYDDEALLSMWMKNTFIPLDILFVRADLTIASIAENTEPQSLRSISASEPVRYVLELNAGSSRRFGIRPGDRLVLQDGGNRAREVRDVGLGDTGDVDPARID